MSGDHIAYTGMAPQGIHASDYSERPSKVSRSKFSTPDQRATKASRGSLAAPAGELVRQTQQWASIVYSGL